MGGGDVFLSGLISYSLAWLERWPGEGDEPLLAQQLVKLPAISSCLFSTWQDGRSAIAQPRAVPGRAMCRMHRVTQGSEIPITFTLLPPKLTLLFAHI